MALSPHPNYREGQQEASIEAGLVSVNDRQKRSTNVPSSDSYCFESAPSEQLLTEYGALQALKRPNVG